VEVTDRVDECQRVIDAAEAAEVSLEGRHRAFLDARFLGADSAVDVTASERLTHLDSALRTAATRLLEERTAAASAHAEQREQMRRLMTGFLERWDTLTILPDPDESVAEFES
ncbi:hypothetical protein HER21_38630, partial [Pseudomonas sp. BGM005]|nr:hypothetical protein [Pseudomonas sp. BG5]